MGNIEKHNKNPNVSYVQGANAHTDKSDDSQKTENSAKVDMKKVKKIKDKVKGLPKEVPQSVNYGK